MAEAALAGGGTIAESAASLGLELQQSGDLGPGRAPGGVGGTTPELEEMLFSESSFAGGIGAVKVPAGAILYEITSREPFDETGFLTQKGSLRVELAGAKRDRMRQSILDQLRRAREVRINEELVRAYDSLGQDQG